jgi:hypothetical protein
LREKYCAQISILLPPVNHTGRLYPEKYISLGHKHLAPGIRFAENGKRKGSYSDVFEADEGKILCSKCNHDAACQSYRKIKIYQSEA